MPHGDAGPYCKSSFPTGVPRIANKFDPLADNAIYSESRLTENLVPENLASFPIGGDSGFFADQMTGVTGSVLIGGCPFPIRDR
jgi:hypothetical protein